MPQKPNAKSNYIKILNLQPGLKQRIMDEVENDEANNMSDFVKHILKRHFKEKDEKANYRKP